MTGEPAASARVAFGLHARNGSAEKLNYEVRITGLLDEVVKASVLCKHSVRLSHVFARDGDQQRRGVAIHLPDVTRYGEAADLRHVDVEDDRIRLVPPHLRHDVGRIAAAKDPVTLVTKDRHQTRHRIGFIVGDDYPEGALDRFDRDGEIAQALAHRAWLDSAFRRVSLFSFTERTSAARSSTENGVTRHGTPSVSARRASNSFVQTRIVGMKRKLVSAIIVATNSVPLMNGSCAPTSKISIESELWRIARPATIASGARIAS
jgi:hypothetical protein